VRERERERERERVDQTMGLLITIQTAYIYRKYIGIKYYCIYLTDENAVRFCPLIH
jgi:hypothetical protein